MAWAEDAGSHAVGKVADRVAESDGAVRGERRCSGEAEGDGLAAGTRNAVSKSDREGDAGDLTTYRC